MLRLIINEEEKFMLVMSVEMYVLIKMDTNEGKKY
jgi:hypothetical protein